MKDYNSLVLEHEAEFQNVFGIRLRDYMRSHIGFDILKFDDVFIKPKNGVSTADTIEQKYGRRAVELIRILL